MAAKSASKKVAMGTTGPKTDKQLLAKYILINTNNLYIAHCMMNHALNQCLRLTSALLLFVLFALATHAQQGALQFVKGGGGGGFIGSNSSSPDPDEIYGSAIDMEGNIIVGGACTWAPMFDSIHFDYMIGTPYNGDNGFIAKYNSCGEIQWVSVIWGKQGEWVTGLDVDNSGNIYVVGIAPVGNTIYDSVIIVTPYGNTKVKDCYSFFAKYSPDGHLLHFKRLPHIPAQSERLFPYQGMFKRLKNNTFLSLCYASGLATTVHAGPLTTLSHTNNLILLDSTGNIIKGELISNDIYYSERFVVDSSENIYLTLFNQADTSFACLDTVFHNCLPLSTYLVKTDTSFTVKKYVIGYNSNQALFTLYAKGSNIYGAERNYNGANFSSDTTHTDNLGGEFTVYKIDTNLSLQWVSRPDSQPMHPGHTWLAIGAARDNVYLGYQHRGYVAWDSFSLNVPLNQREVVLLRLRASDGVCVESKLMNGNVSERDLVTTIITDDQGSAYYMGIFAANIGIPTDSIYANGNIASPDYFIVKWGLPCSDTAGSLDAPAPPINLVATATGTNSIGINWNDVAQGETGFNLYRSPNGINGWSMVASTAANTPIYSNTGLQPNTTYWYRTTSFNQNSESAYSNIDSATTWPATCGTSINTANTDSLYIFNNTNTGTAPYTYAWSINGNSSTQATLTAVLDTANTYYICVTVTDSYGCTATACDTVSIAAPVCAAHINTTQTGTYSYSFNAGSTGPAPYSYVWSVDGNSQAATANPFTRTFANIANTYIVCATVTAANGCTATACDTVTVTPATCATNLTYTHVGNTYTFTPINTGTGPFTYQWRDGGNPINAWDSAEVFLQPGTHNICVTVTDWDNCTASGCQTITIDSCNISIHYTDSSYWYTFYTTNGGVAPFQYQWQRSNSIFSYQDTTTTALLPGLNTICVKVTDANGCIAWACEEITVGTDTCTASISYINTGNSYAFTASSTGTAPYTYKWRNNGGSVFSTAQNASINLQSGSNNVCVTVTDANNCSATACQQVIISGIAEDVQAGFSVYPNPVSGAVHIAIDAAQAGVIELTITDLQGRIISSGTREVIHGSNLLAYSTEQWAAGIYQLHILYGTQHYTAKLIKM